MKSTTEIQADIDVLVSKWRDVSDSEKEERKKELEKDNTRLSLLRHCIYFLEQNKRPEFVEEMQKENVHKIGVYENRFTNWEKSLSQLDRQRIQKPRDYYYKRIAPDEKKVLSDARKQLRTLNYLLG